MREGDGVGKHFENNINTYDHSEADFVLLASQGGTIMQRAFWWALLLLLCFVSMFAPHLVRGQERPTASPASDVLLSVSGEVEHPLQLGSAELAKLPRHTERVTDHSGAEAAFEG